MYENLANIESMLVGMLLILFLVAFAFLLIIIYLSSRDKRLFKPIIRPFSDENIINQLFEKIKNNSIEYSENIVQLLEDQNSSPLIETNSNIAMIILKNYGNSPAIDIELKKMSYCLPSDGIENKFFSLSENEYKVILLNIPNDLVNYLGVDKISFKYKNIHNTKFKSKFTYTISKTLTKKLNDKTNLYIIVQV